jgi:hypothetical protein
MRQSQKDVQTANKQEGQTDSEGAGPELGRAWFEERQGESCQEKHEDACA